jgi:hypothetical protein
MSGVSAEKRASLVPEAIRFVNAMVQDYGDCIRALPGKGYSPEVSLLQAWRGFGRRS